MKKAIALVLVLICMLAMVSCQLNQPDFENFQEYEDDFSIVKNFLVDFNFSRNDSSSLIVDLNSRSLTIDGEEISDSTMEDSVKAVYDKGFTYIEINEDCIIFWKDETGYYGVLWSVDPEDAIDQMVKSNKPNLKSRKLANEWYEIGALDSI